MAQSEYSIEVALTASPSGSLCRYAVPRWIEYEVDCSLPASRGQSYALAELSTELAAKPYRVTRAWKDGKQVFPADAGDESRALADCKEKFDKVVTWGPVEELIRALQNASDDGMTKAQMQDAIAQFFAEQFPEPEPKPGVKPAAASLGEVQDGGRYRGMGFNGEA